MRRGLLLILAGVLASACAEVDVTNGTSTPLTVGIYTSSPDVPDTISEIAPGSGAQDFSARAGSYVVAAAPSSAYRKALEQARADLLAEIDSDILSGSPDPAALVRMQDQVTGIDNLVTHLPPATIVRCSGRSSENGTVSITVTAKADGTLACG